MAPNSSRIAVKKTRTSLDKPAKRKRPPIAPRKRKEDHEMAVAVKKEAAMQESLLKKGILDMDAAEIDGKVQRAMDKALSGKVDS